MFDRNNDFATASTHHPSDAHNMNQTAAPIKSPAARPGDVLQIVIAAVLPGNDVLDADEVFLTNAIMQVLPVVAVEKHAIADGKVGECARRFLAAYRDRVTQELRAANNTERNRL